MVVILNYFDVVIGPKILLKYPRIEETEDILKITRSMDFNVDEEEGFVEMVDEVRALNYMFTVKSPLSRGGEDFISLSYIITETDVDINFYKEKILTASQRIKKIENAWMGLREPYTDKNEHRVKLKEIIKDLDIDLRSKETATVGYLSSGSDIYREGLIPVPKIIKEEKEGMEILDRATKRNFLTVYKENFDGSFTLRAYVVNSDNIYKIQVYSDKVNITTPRIVTAGIMKYLKGNIIATSGICQGESICTFEAYFEYMGDKERLHDFRNLLKKEIKSESEQYPFVVCSPVEKEVAIPKRR